MFKSRIINFINNGGTDNSKLLRSVIVFFSSILLLVFAGYFLYEIVLFTSLPFSLSIELMLGSLYSVWAYIYDNILPNYLLMVLLLSTIIILILAKAKIEENPRVIKKHNISGIILFVSCFLLLYYSFTNFLNIISQSNIDSHFYNFLSYVVSACFLYLGLFSAYLFMSYNITDIIHLFKKDIKEKKKIKYLSIAYCIFIVLSIYYQDLSLISIALLVLIYIIYFFIIADNNLYSGCSVFIMKKRGYDFSKNLSQEEDLDEPFCISLNGLNLAYSNGLIRQPLKRRDFIESVTDVVNNNNINRDEILTFYLSNVSSKVYVFNLDNKLLKIINL